MNELVPFVAAAIIIIMETQLATPTSSAALKASLTLGNECRHKKTTTDGRGGKACDSFYCKYHEDVLESVMK